MELYRIEEEVRAEEEEEEEEADKAGARGVVTEAVLTVVVVVVVEGKNPGVLTVLEERVVVSGVVAVDKYTPVDSGVAALAGMFMLV